MLGFPEIERSKFDYNFKTALVVDKSVNVVNPPVYVTKVSKTYCLLLASVNYWGYPNYVSLFPCIFKSVLIPELRTSYTASSTLYYRELMPALVSRLFGSDIYCKYNIYLFFLLR